MVSQPDRLKAVRLSQLNALYESQWVVVALSQIDADPEGRHYQIFSKVCGANNLIVTAALLRDSMTFMVIAGCLSPLRDHDELAVNGVLATRSEGPRLSAL
jgi:hypothetical protein